MDIGSLNIKFKQCRCRQRDGSITLMPRYVLLVKDPRTGKRRPKRFKKKKEAEEFRARILMEVEGGSFNSRKSLTIKEAFEYWLNNRKSQIKAETLRGYKTMEYCIVGPMLSGNSRQRLSYSITGKIPEGCELLPSL